MQTMIIDQYNAIYFGDQSADPPLFFYLIIFLSQRAWSSKIFLSGVSEISTTSLQARTWLPNSLT